MVHACRGAEESGLAFTAAAQGQLRDCAALVRMAAAPAGATEEIEVFLNERYIPSRGWSSGHLVRCALT